MTSQSSSLIGTVIDDRYRVDRVVGEGGFGTVYAAWHLALGAPVALKVLKLDASVRAEKRNELLASFFEEGRVLTRLKHPNIVSALDLGTVTAGAEATPYLAMEWCEGHTLKSLLAERGRLPLAEAYAVVERLADALGHAHSLGVSHRDLKPGNVMMRERAGEIVPQLIDFGIAKLVDPGAAEDSTATRGAARRAFTPAYAAPEQVAGGRTGPWTDVHALGLLLITLLTGEKPYGDSEDENLAVIDTARPTAERADIRTGAFAAVIARAVAARPQDRYADGHRLRDALREAAASELGETVPPSLRRSLPSALLEPAPGTPAPPEAGNTITEQATAASLPPRRSDEPRAARRWPMAALLATPVVLAAGGTLLYLDRQTAGGAGPTEIASSEPNAEAEATASTSASAALPPATFCDLSEDEKKARIRTTGLRGYGWRPSATSPQLTSLLDPTGAWLSLTAMTVAGTDTKERLTAAKVLLANSSEAIDLLPERGIAYAMEGSCLVAVRGRTSEASRVLSTLVTGFTSELRGDTFGGGNAIPFTPIASVKWNGEKAKSLATLTEGELVQRMRDAGVEITDAQRAGNALTLSVRNGPARGTVAYYQDPNLTAQLPGLLRGGSEKEPTFSATEGLVAVIAFGSPDVVNETLFSRVVKGLGARVVKTTR
jgi:serine/threonine protein kinase